MQLIIIFLTIILFFAGASVGSFINMLVYRIKNNLPLGGRSFSDKTKEALKFIDLIPLVSFLIFKGKSRTSGEKLPILYPAVEFLTGIMAIIVFIKYFSVTQISSLIFVFLVFIFCAFLIFFAVYDFLYWSLPIKMIILFMFYSVFLKAVFMFLNNVILSVFLFNFLIAFLLFLLFLGLSRWKTSELSINDALLVFSVSLLVGGFNAVVLITITAVIGFLIGVIKITFTKNLLEKVQFAPLVAFATFLVLTFLY